mmetsp:Transcript_53385/g.173634  ORF Transcript_53385/g.173634 Transcript_53385/m.173634 type:complete len:481 (+) Transcript_53385:359-1801(+)
MNSAARSSLAQVATGALGVETTVGAIRLGVWDARSTVSNVAVANPPGFAQGIGKDQRLDFLELAEGVFDLRLNSLFSSPWELQEIKLTDLRVNFEQNYNSKSNAGWILAHLESVRTPPPAAPAPTEQHRGPEWQRQGGGGGPKVAEEEGQKQSGKRRRDANAVSTKIIADRLLIRNVSISVCIHPLCDKVAPVVFGIPQVLVKDIGKKEEGVLLYELLDITVQAVIIAAINSAPDQLGYDMHRSMGDNVRRILDYASVHCDMGDGLKEIHDWTSYQLSRLGGALEAAGGELQAAEDAVAPGSVQDKDVVKDLGAAGGNLSSALASFGEAVVGALSSLHPGKNADHGNAIAEAEAGKDAGLAAQDFKKAETEGMNEAALVVGNIFGALMSGGADATTNMTPSVASIEAEAAEATTEALQVLQEQRAAAARGEPVSREEARLEAGKAMRAAEKSLEAATGLESQLLGALQQTVDQTDKKSYE